MSRKRPENRYERNIGDIYFMTHELLCWVECSRGVIRPQRVCTRAVRPPVVILDEWTGVIDCKSKRNIEVRLLLQMLRSLRRTRDVVYRHVWAFRVADSFGICSFKCGHKPASRGLGTRGDNSRTRTRAGELVLSQRLVRTYWSRKAARRR